MGCMRPATPGFLLTTIATGLLAVVSFCVPYFKSVYFLKATATQSGVTAIITFGTLGYCVEINGETTCSSPSVGYELDINGLVGNNLPIQIPNAVVKWLTYALVLHLVALALAAGSAVFGLLAHIREMAMTCCSTFISGLAAAIAMVAFVFDLALFFIAKSRINHVGSAQIGNAVWLTLAAWVLLFFSGCFYTLGRCCISKRAPRNDWDKRKDPPAPEIGEQLRLDAVKAEADRKARQKASEGGLPAFHERQPLTTGYDDGNAIYTDKPNTPGGYMQAPAGSRAVDQYYNNAGPSAGYNANASSAYPPSPQRQYAPSTYAPSTYSYNAPQQPHGAYPPQQYHSTPPLPVMQPYHSATPPPHQPYPPQQPYVASPQQQQFASPHDQYQDLGAIRTTSPQQQYMDHTYLAAPGHVARGTSYHSAVSHGNSATEYSQYDPYDGVANDAAYYSGVVPAPTPTSATPSDAYYTPSGQSQYNSQYTTGYTPPAKRDGYGANSVPPLGDAGYFPPTPEQSTSSSTPAPKGPRKHRDSLLHTVNADEDSPPGYELETSEHSQVPGAWGKS